jgi:hypothetical protein
MQFRLQNTCMLINYTRKELTQRDTEVAQRDTE